RAYHSFPTRRSSDLDDEEILAEAAGLEVVALRRPPELASDTALARDVALHTLRALDDAARPFEALAIVQPTAPFTAPEDVAATRSEEHTSELQSPDH